MEYVCVQVRELTGLEAKRNRLGVWVKGRSKDDVRASAGNRRSVVDHVVVGYASCVRYVRGHD